METIALVRMTGTGKEHKTAHSFDEARAVLTEWEERPDTVSGPKAQKAARPRRATRRKAA